MAKLLLIDDDEGLGRRLESYFRQFGLGLTCATHPGKAINLLKKQTFDLVLLDIMLPEQNGFEVCREIRRWSAVPIIMLTARGDVTDRVVGLEIGADDYVPKPFDPRELVARVQSVLRRVRDANSRRGRIQQGDLDIDLDQRTVSLAGRPIGLTTAEYRLLVLLASRPGKTFSRDEILNELSGTECPAFSRSVDIAVSRLRQKLGDLTKDPEFQLGFPPRDAAPRRFGIRNGSGFQHGGGLLVVSEVPEMGSRWEYVSVCRTQDGGFGPG